MLFVAFEEEPSHPQTRTFQNDLWSLELMVRLCHCSSSLLSDVLWPVFYPASRRLTFPVKEKSLLPSGNKRVSRISCPKPKSQTPVSFAWVASQTLWE